MKTPKRHIMFIAGEPSGDLHGARLIRSLKEKDPNLIFSGIGGDMMKNEGMPLFFHLDGLSAMGVTEVIAQFRTIKNAFNLFRQKICLDRPDLLILIDYPGFNLKAAAFAKKMGIRVLYYITPKVWAWKRSRIKKIKASVDHAALIFPFEVPIFQKEKIPHSFVGHPLMDIYPEPLTGKKSSCDELLIGLLPGSRPSEIEAHLALMLRSARLIAGNTNNVNFLVSAASSVDRERFQEILDPLNRDGLFTVVAGPPLDIFKRCNLLVAASGTVTLEAAVCGVPMVILYRMSKISYRLARFFVRLSHVGLANIIMGREVIPELLQDDATPEKIAETVQALVFPDNLCKMRNELKLVRSLLGGPGAAARTAGIALDLLK